MGTNLVIFSITDFCDGKGLFIYVDAGTIRRWLLPTGVVTEDRKEASALRYETYEDAKCFLNHWMPARGFMNCDNTKFYSYMKECQALDCSIEHWKQVFLNALAGSDNVGALTCSIYQRAKRIKKIAGFACVEYQEFIDCPNTENALVMLNMLVELRNKKYGYARYTDFGTIKSVEAVRSEYSREGIKIVQDFLNAKDTDVVAVPKDFMAYNWLQYDFAKLERLVMSQMLMEYNMLVDSEQFYIQRIKARAKDGCRSYCAYHRASRKYLCRKGTLQPYQGNVWYATFENVVAAVKQYEHRALTVGEIEDELGIKMLLTAGDVQDAVSEPVPEGYGAIKKVKLEQQKQYIFKPGDIVLKNNLKRIIVDLGFHYNHVPNKRFLGAVDEQGNLVATSKVDDIADNFKYSMYKKVGELIEDSLPPSVDCPIIKGDVVITPWDTLRFVVDDNKGGLGVFDFSGHLCTRIKQDALNEFPYRKVGRIEDFV